MNSPSTKRLEIDRKEMERDHTITKAQGTAGGTHLTDPPSQAVVQA